MSNEDFNVLIPQPAVLRRYGITDMTLWRWRRRKDLAFPVPLEIGKRNYFYSADLAEFEARRPRKPVAPAVTIPEPEDA
ncbi:helix-turn-helix transcriptional regulator [Mesorhizobium sp. IMUNJ 23232]|uniref:helix-turn-helix transcriptional regulator n=1 Tax=Mesorhizobium sp. IMUNJ 23232 TaxID=3376064 RepID=UPI00378DC812